MGPLDLLLLLLLAGTIVATVGGRPMGRCQTSRPHPPRRGKMCCRGRGMWFWMPMLFIAPAIGCWLLFGVIFFGGGHATRHHLAIRRAHEKKAAALREAAQLKRLSLEKLRAADLRGVGEATVEVVFQPERVAAQGLDADDLARGIKRLIAEIEAAQSGDAPRGIAPLVKLNAVVVRDDAVGTVRLSDVARLSRRRMSGRTAWRDTELLIRFEPDEDTASQTDAAPDSPSDEPANRIGLEQLKLALETAGASASESQHHTDAAERTEGVWHLAENGALILGFAPHADVSDGGLIPDAALQSDEAHEADAADLAQAKPAAPSRAGHEPEKKKENAQSPSASSPARPGGTSSEDATAHVAAVESAADAKRAAPQARAHASSQSSASQRPEETPSSSAATEDRRNAGAPSPLATMRGPDDPPEWIGRSSYFANGVYHLYAKDGPFIDREQCEEALPELLRRETQRYVQRYLGLGSDAEPVAFSLAVVQAEMLEGVWIGPWHEPSDGVLPTSDLFDRYALHVALEFDDADRAYFERVWNQQQVRHRLWATAIGSGSLLALLAIVFGYLKIDTATRGYYSGRLKLAALSGAVAVVGGAVALLVN